MTAIAIFLFGMISYKENLLPRKIIYEIKSHIIPKDKPLSESHHKTSGNVQSPPKFRILPYAQGTPLFIDRNYEDITERFGLGKVGHVPRVKNVKTSVSQHNAFTRGL